SPRPSSRKRASEIRFHRRGEGRIPHLEVVRSAAGLRGGILGLAITAISARRQEDTRLKILVKEAHARSRQTYGSPRVHLALKKQHVFVSRKRVIRLMQEDGLVARVRRRYRCTTVSEHDQPVAANLLDRNFAAERPNHRWLGDATELLTANG